MQLKTAVQRQANRSAFLQRYTRWLIRIHNLDLNGILFVVMRGKRNGYGAFLNRRYEAVAVYLRNGGRGG